MSKVFKILAIDGGGIKGLYSSTILEHLEKEFDIKTTDYFDMICGTSTGGLISLALSLGISANEISKLYSQKGEKIFPQKMKFAQKFKQYVYRGKYSDKPLENILRDLFGNRTIGESKNLLCIPSYSITDGRNFVIKYDHKDGNLGRDNSMSYVDAALATSAAPTYFPVCQLPYYNDKQLIDGGVWANNPSLVGLIEAISFFVGKNREYDSIEILSISSLKKNKTIKPFSKRHKSFWDWNSQLFDVFSNSQEQFIHYFLTELHKHEDIKVKYVRIDSEPVFTNEEELIEMDLVSEKSIKLLMQKGNDAGYKARRDPSVTTFFNNKKTYIIN
ncbi:CBASS cGAMP-activated phospholipase [Phocaeicola paurosaccharolyticus]|uniref:CBASS cGAMP-activated phospholipase n=1 Tax=Phocaeicola paurosaccharolyticus TaxID=732242 RepID=UPI002FDF8537